MKEAEAEQTQRPKSKSQVIYYICETAGTQIGGKEDEKEAGRRSIHRTIPVSGVQIRK